MYTSNKIYNKLFEIYQAINKSFLQQEEEHKINSLFVGNIGVLLFLGYYAYFSKLPAVKKTYKKYSDHCIKLLSKHIEQFSYCNGLAGSLLGLRLLCKEGLADIELTEYEKQIEPFISAQMINDIKRGNYDFLHGALGIALYLNDAFPDKQYYKIISYYLEKYKISHTKFSIKWISTIQSTAETREKVFNISLSHGISSIVAYYVRILESGKGTDLERNLLDGAVNYILEQEIEHEKYGSFFPPISKEYNISRSRMGWCYGDLGIAITLYKAGKIRNRIDWMKKSYDIIKYAVKRVDLSDGFINDAGLCHGAAGIAQIFRRFYFYTKDPLFLTCSNYWISVVLKLGNFQDGPAGYKSFRGSEPHWITEFNMLGGIAGIGLSLLASEENKYYSGWDRLLLL